MQVLKNAIKPFIVEDSAFYIEALKGFPGTFVNTSFDTLGEERIVKLLNNEKNRRALIESVLVYGNSVTKKLTLFTSYYHGTISDKPRGLNTKGWKITRIFIPDGEKKTLAENNNKEWRLFLYKFENNDHFEKFGKWFSK